MILLLLQSHFYYCNHTSTIALILTLKYLNYRDFWLLRCFLQCYDMRQTCVSCVLQCVSLQSNTLRVLSGFQRIGKYQKVVQYQKILECITKFGIRDDGEYCGSWRAGLTSLFSLYSALFGSHVDTSILCCALLCSHVDISILCSGADDELLTAAAADSHWHCKQ